MVWKLDDTRALVEKHFGESQAELLEPTLISLRSRQEFARYHFSEYKRLLFDALDSKLPEVHPLQVLFPVDQETFLAAMVLEQHVAAHSLACVQNIHAVADTLSYAAAICLGLNLPPCSLREGAIGLSRVESKLRAKSSTSVVASCLKRIIDNPIFKHIDAISNISKHRYVIAPHISVDATGNDPKPYRIKFRAMKYKQNQFSEIDAEDLLEPAHSFLSHRVVECGNEINRVLSKGLPLL